MNFSKYLKSSSKGVIIDTNLWGPIRRLFDEILEREDSLTYEQLWEKFETSDHVEKIVNRYLNDTKKYALAIIVIKLIIHIKMKKSVVYVLTEIYNESIHEISSVMGKPQKINVSDEVKRIRGCKKKFLESLPGVIIIESDRELVEGKDFPKKSQDAKMKRIFMSDFITNYNSDELNDLKSHLSKIENFDQNNFDCWNCELDTIEMILNKCPADIRKIFVKHLRELRKFNKNRKKHESFGDPIEKIVDRLLKNNEELCFNDLKIYLFAKLYNVPVITRNIKAFFEINDAVFMNYFENVEFLFPQINFDDDPTKLDEVNNFENYLKSISSHLDSKIN